MFFFISYEHVAAKTESKDSNEAGWKFLEHLFQSSTQWFAKGSPAPERPLSLKILGLGDPSSSAISLVKVVVVDVCAFEGQKKTLGITSGPPPHIFHWGPC